jgi:hypothetical protein
MFVSFTAGFGRLNPEPRRKLRGGIQTPIRSEVRGAPGRNVVPGEKAALNEFPDQHVVVAPGEQRVVHREIGERHVRQGDLGLGDLGLLGCADQEDAHHVRRPSDRFGLGEALFPEVRSDVLEDAIAGAGEHTTVGAPAPSRATESDGTPSAANTKSPFVVATGAGKGLPMVTRKLFDVGRAREGIVIER